MATKIKNPLFPSLKRGGYSCRITFRDEARGERYFDSEWSVIAIDANRFALNRSMGFKGSYGETKPAGTIGKAIRVGDVVGIRVRRWTMRSVVDLPIVSIKIESAEIIADGRVLVVFSKA